LAQNFPGLEPTVVALDSLVHVAQRHLASAYDSVASLIEETYPVQSNGVAKYPHVEKPERRRYCLVLQSNSRRSTEQRAG
jgi:hypothetical protein